MAKKGPYLSLEGQRDYVIYHDVQIPMRDGTKLTADIYFPCEGGNVDFSRKYPAVLCRNPYYTWDFIMNPYRIDSTVPNEGFVFVSNKVRGTDTSEGEFDPLRNEGWGEKQDGIDTAAWIRKQPWSNGQVAAYGKSYMGGSALHLTLADQGESVDTAFLVVPATLYERVGWVYCGEFLEFNSVPYWSLMHFPDQMNHLPAETVTKIEADIQEFGNPIDNKPALFGTLASLYKEHGLNNMPILRHMPFWQRWIANRENPEYFAYSNTKERSHAVAKPVMVLGGWYDLFNKQALDTYEHFVRDAPSEDVARSHRLLVGPWGHVPPAPLARRFPDGPVYGNKLIMDWMKLQLCDTPCAFIEDNPVVLYVMGENRWRAEQAWPLSDAVPTRFYLHSDGKANTMMGDGEITAAAPEQVEAADRYVYDPHNPTPSLGGHTLMGRSEDQRSNELHADVLVYTGDILEEDLEFTGCAKAKLYASTSATDTDFFVKIVDVTPEGCAYNIVSAGRRGRYLAKGLTAPQALEPEKVCEWEVEFPATSYVLKAGHQLRVEITSSDFPNYDINPNQFIDLNASTQADYVPARQMVYHDHDHPTWIELPVIPASHPRAWLADWPYDQEDSSAVEFTKMDDPTNPKPFKVYDGAELGSVG